jgi:hypothetical protein
MYQSRGVNHVGRIVRNVVIVLDVIYVRIITTGVIPPSIRSCRYRLVPNHAYTLHQRDTTLIIAPDSVRSAQELVKDVSDVLDRINASNVEDQP